MVSTPYEKEQAKQYIRECWGDNACVVADTIDERDIQNVRKSVNFQFWLLNKAFRDLTDAVVKECKPILDFLNKTFGG